MLVGELAARLILDDSAYNRGLDTSKAKGEQTANSIGSAFKKIGSIAGGMILFDVINAGFDSLKSVLIDFNAQMEQSRIGFSTMLGSAEAADTFLRQLADFAAQTPFEFQDVQSAAKKFLAFGWAAKDVLPTLQAVGNAASGLGLTAEGIQRMTIALGQIKAKGKVQGDELLQLAEAGVPAYDILAKKLNLTGDQISRIGELSISADVAIQALVEGMNERFGGMMQAQSDSMIGMLSTIKDNSKIIMGQLTQSIFDGIKNGLTGIRDASNQIADLVRGKNILESLSLSGWSTEASMGALRVNEALQQTQLISAGTAQNLIAISLAFDDLSEKLERFDGIGGTSNALLTMEGATSGISKLVEFLGTAEVIKQALIELILIIGRFVVETNQEFESWIADIYSAVDGGFTSVADIIDTTLAEINSSFKSEFTIWPAWMTTILNDLENTFSTAFNNIYNIVISAVQNTVADAVNEFTPLKNMLAGLADLKNAVFGGDNPASMGGFRAMEGKKSSFELLALKLDRAYKSTVGASALANHSGGAGVEPGGGAGGSSSGAKTHEKTADQIAQEESKHWKLMVDTGRAKMKEYVDLLKKFANDINLTDDTRLTFEKEYKDIENDDAKNAEKTAQEKIQAEREYQNFRLQMDENYSGQYLKYLQDNAAVLKNEKGEESQEYLKASREAQLYAKQLTDKQAEEARRSAQERSAAEKRVVDANNATITSLITGNASMTDVIKQQWTEFISYIISQTMKLNNEMNIFKLMFGGLFSSSSVNLSGSRPTGVSGPTGSNGGFYKNVSSILGFADGGNYPGGLAVVGERGPELINFNRGGKVYTNQQTNEMLNGSGTSASSSNIKVYQTITSPTPEAFRQSQGQVANYTARAMQKAARRNG